MTRVFISYTHDDEQHSERVVRLADRLGADGFDVHLDRYVTGTPEDGWPAWMERQIAEADFVLVVCSEAYYERYRGDGDVTIGLGGRWEGRLLRDALYGDPARIARCVPLLAPDAAVATIPDPLRFSATRHQLVGGYEGLLRHLRGQSERTEQGDAASAPDSDRFSESIRERFAALELEVEQLTTDQYRVIQQLSGQRRALISGCAGSGKTLIAAEKAMRLARAGVSTLFLCHNPLLAEWVCELTSGSGVRVRAFEDLVAEFSDQAHPAVKGTRWTNYSQPTSETLAQALAALRAAGGQAQAVVVDEGQDFAPDWWPLVEACLDDERSGILYVFFDDRQSLLPFRSAYPIDGPPLDLSRNCRNGGAVYEVMRQLTPDAPLPEQALSSHGEAAFFHRGPGRLTDSVRACLDWLHERGAAERAVAVLSGGVAFVDSVLATREFAYGLAFDWRAALATEFRGLVKAADALGRPIELKGPEAELWTLLEGLSSGPLPTKADRAIVRRAAGRFRFEKGGSDVVLTALEWRPHRPYVPAGANLDEQRVELRLQAPGRAIGPSTIARALYMGVWMRSIPAPTSAAFAPHGSAQAGQIPVYGVGEIKGLERDVVLLVTQGEAPEPLHEAFVGVSRARSLLAAAIDEHALAMLPIRLREQMGLAAPRWNR